MILYWVHNIHQISIAKNKHIYQIFTKPTFKLSFLKKFCGDDLLLKQNHLPHISKKFTHLARKREPSSLKHDCICVYIQRDDMLTYNRMTWLLESQVTWNQVQGLTRVGSQLCNTLVGSDSLLLKECKAFPARRT